MDERTYKKLRWRCRRGMLELDCILLPFFDDVFDTLSEDEQALFGELLHEADPTLANWLMKHVPAEPPYIALVDKITAYARPNA